MVISRKALLGVSVSLVSMMAPALADAQTTEPTAAASATASSSAATGATATSGLQEIVVTAQQRGENQQKAAIAIDVVKGSDLVSSGVTNVESLGKLVPALTIEGTSNGNLVFIRGVGNFTFQPRAATRSAFDRYGRERSARLPDLERIIMIPQTGGSDASALLDVSPMSRMQISVLFIAVLLAMMDGFDLLGMAYVAPALSHAWGIGKGTLGFLLSTSLIGMALGSLALSPLADVTGRKPMVLSSIGLVVAGSLLSALCHAVPTLAACRVLTGIGIGTMVPLTTTIASEFANTTRRPFAIAATTVGLPAGSIVGALVAAVLLKHVGWPAVFVSGAIAGALLLPVIMLWLPESPSFLIARRPSDALERLNRILLRLGRPAFSELPPGAASKRASYRSLFAPELIGITLRLGAVQILVSTTAYYFISWLPQVIADLGFPASTASLASAVSSVVGMISGLLFGFFAARFGPVRLASIAMIGFG